MDQSLTTAVVMATYNGERYIREQLISILQQTVQPDNVIIVDDCSTDSTVNIIKEFIALHGLMNTWNISKNSVNIGWRRNFLNLLNKADADLIFTADQDDLWLPNKIEIMLNEFQNNNKISVLVSDYQEKIESSGKSAKLKRIVTAGEKKCGQVLFTTQNLLLLRPGCVFAIKKTFVSQINKYYSILSNPAHDVAMWGAALSYSQLYYLAEPTIIFRRHSDSSFQKEVSQSLKKSSLYQERIDKLKRFNVRLLAMTKFLDIYPNIIDYSKKKKIISREVKNNKGRINVLQKRSLIFLLTNIWKYRSFFAFSADFKHIFKLRSESMRYSK